MLNGTATKVQTRIFWIVPWGLMIANFLYWPLIRGTSIAFPLFNALVPLVFGLFGVGTATRRWHVWKWKLSWLHVGFLYSAYGTLGPLVFNDLLALPFTLQSVVEMTVSTGLLCALTGTAFDMHSMEEGMLSVPHTIGWGTVKAVSSYSYYFFGYLGLCVGMQTKIAYYYLVQLGETNMVWLLTPLSVLFMSLTVLGYFGKNIWREQREKRQARGAHAAPSVTGNVNSPAV